MLTDGVRLVEGSIIDIGVVSPDRIGSTLPASAIDGTSYELTATYSGKLPGVYMWHKNEWVLKSPDRSATPYDISGGSISTLSASAIILRHAVSRSFGMTSGFFGSIAIAGQAASVEAVLEIRRITRQGTDEKLGEIRYSLGETLGLFVQDGVDTMRFAQGEVLYVRGPAVADLTLSELSFTLAGFLM